MSRPLTPDKNTNSETPFSPGVSPDIVHLRTVFFWIVLGIFLVAVTLFGVYNMYTYNQFLSSQRAAEQAVFHDLVEMRTREHQLLNSLELIDEERLRFRIPIDSAMNLVIMDYAGH